jgi:hypothetical protein
VLIAEQDSQTFLRLADSLSSVMETEMDFETSEICFTLMYLIEEEDFIASDFHKSFKSCDFILQISYVLLLTD